MLSDESMNEINNILNVPESNEILDFFNNIPIPPVWTDELPPLTLAQGHRPTFTRSQSLNRLENIFMMPNQILQELMTISDETRIVNPRLYNIINESLNTTSVYKNVLSEKGEASLKKEKYNSKEHKNPKCPIMHIYFSEKDEVTVLPCKHCFDNDSIMHWLKEEKAECPVCRYTLDSEEKHKNTEENT